MIIETRQLWTPVLVLLCALAGCSSDRRGKAAFPQLGRDYYVNNRQALRIPQRLKRTQRRMQAKEPIQIQRCISIT